MIPRIIQTEDNITYRSKAWADNIDQGLNNEYIGFHKVFRALKIIFSVPFRLFLLSTR